MNSSEPSRLPSAGEAQPRIGRRPGSASSRAEVLRAAKHLFASQGYDAATVRAIAAEAGVDSALVVRFFGGKENLFVAVLNDLTVALPGFTATATGGTRQERGRRLATFYFDLWENPASGEAAQALIRAAIGSPRAATIMKDFLDQQFLANTAGEQLATVAAILLGVAVARYVLRAGPLAHMPVHQLIDKLAPTLQLHLNDLDEPSDQK